MKNVLSSALAVAIASLTFGAFAQPATKSTETTVEKSKSVQAPKSDAKVDEKKTTTTTTTDTPTANADSKNNTTTTTSERKSNSDKGEVKSKTTTTETNKKN